MGALFLGRATGRLLSELTYCIDVGCFKYNLRHLTDLTVALSWRPQALICLVICGGSTTVYVIYARTPARFRSARCDWW